MTENVTGQNRNILRFFGQAAALLAIIIISVYVSQRNYLFFHTAIELQSIVIAFAVFVLVLNCDKKVNNGYFIVLGIAMGLIAILDFFHTMAYKGLNIFPGYDTNLPTQLWIMARYMQSISIVLAFFFLDRRAQFLPITAVYSVVTALLLYTVFFTGLFPACYVEGAGLTGFKKASEYIISIIIALGIFLLYRNRDKFVRRIYVYLGLAFLATIGSELSLVFYVSVYGTSNMVGHILKLTAFYFIYKAIVETSIKSPMQTLMLQLQQTIDRLEQAQGVLQDFSYLDGLTGIANRRKFDEYLEIEWDRAVRNAAPISLIMGDIDNFKFFNDLYGHQQGDQCLRAVAGVLKQTVRRPADLAARYGGEEFAIILPETESHGAVSVAEKIRRNVEALQIENARSLPWQYVTISLGAATFLPGPGTSPAEMVDAADKALYQAKGDGRNRVREYKQND